MVDETLSRDSFECRGLEQLEYTAKKIVEFSKDVRVWLFYGEMGAGKTTLIKAICEYFEVEDVVNSPTFSIVNEYENNDGQIFYHFDFYRIKDESDALEIGCYEYFDSGDYCFIEWPSKIPNLLPDSVLKIDISIVDNNVRLIDLTRHD